MKKCLLAVLLLVMFGHVYAKAHGPAGCGLGLVLFEDKQGMGFNILAGLLNSSGTQTFGMSTGTLGCEDATTAKVTAVSFVEANRVALANDIARGGGETLQTYLSMIGRTDADSQKNIKKLQQNFSNIFSEESTPAQIHHNILATI